MVIADGFGCRTQIAAATSRRALHLADVLEMAARDGIRGPAGNAAEWHYAHEYKPEGSHATGAAAAATIGAAAAADAIWRARWK